MLFPPPDPFRARTSIELVPDADGWPRLFWTGESGSGTDFAGGLPLVRNGPGMPLLGEHSRGLFTRPHLRGHRVSGDGDGVATGRSWTTQFTRTDLRVEDSTLRVEGVDWGAGLDVVVQMESLEGGALRCRCTVTNTAPGTYVVDGVELALPVPDHLVEVLDFTGRHEGEGSPQRSHVTDGLWLREGRFGRPGLGAATMAVLGTVGFSPTSGEVLGVHVAWSGNAVLRVERDAATGTTLGGGEFLQPGELSLAHGESYTTPWVFFAAANDGLDGLAARFHAYQRSLPAHPVTQPVILNVWEAVYFGHDMDRLRAIADRAARVGVERFVLDDGWFGNRPDDTSGLGDWWVSERVWPQGLSPLVDHVHGLGMGFGLWFEPEMVNPDSDLYRAHPDWILSSGSRVPLLDRHQLVLDLSRQEVWQYLYDGVHAVLDAYPIEYVKWDHNRDLLEAGSAARAGAPVVRAQTQAFYRLLDALRAAHPDVEWESCASGGGRVDLGVLERVQRVWTSDMTDALARQRIQRWATQILAPEYVGAHVSAPTSHMTGRTLPLSFRAATALFGSFGIEWDLTTATEDDLDELADWVARYKRLRGFLHSGRTVRPESNDPAVLLHGVVAADRSQALLAHVQLDESVHNRGIMVRVPGLDSTASYTLAWEGPVRQAAASKSAPLPDGGPTDGMPLSGEVLSRRGFWVPRRRAESVTLVHLKRVTGS